MDTVKSVLSFAFNNAGLIATAVGIYAGGCNTPRTYAGIKAWIKSKL